jgi:hypothetical protein
MAKIFSISSFSWRILWLVTQGVFWSVSLEFNEYTGNRAIHYTTDWTKESEIKTYDSVSIKLLNVFYALFVWFGRIYSSTDLMRCERTTFLVTLLGCASVQCPSYSTAQWGCSMSSHILQNAPPPEGKIIAHFWTHSLHHSGKEIKCERISNPSHPVTPT